MLVKLKKPLLLLTIGLSALTLVSCEESTKKPTGEAVKFDLNPFPSNYHVIDYPPVLFTNVNVLDGIGGYFENTSVLISAGKIIGIGTEMSAKSDTLTVDARGKWLTPGIIDVHSHLGVYPSPSGNAHSDGNEATAPVTAQVWAEHSIWPQDPGFQRALAGGITAMQILPGSANLVGGRGVTVKNMPGTTVQDMKFPNAPYGLKMACGENPKRVYGSKGGPSTRMGNVAGYRQSWADAQDYQRSWDKYYVEFEAGKDPKVPKRDLKLETLALALKGEILVHMHCYRADDMGTMLDVMKEFNYKITSFHHAVESYKIADRLAVDGVCSSMWADWWGFKLEAYDGIQENIPMVHAAKACAIVHSDSELGIQRLNQEASKAWTNGKNAGLDISEADAWQWLSSNPAKALGIFEQTGSLENGKNADVVLWSANPFSVYAQAEQVYIDGALVFDRNKPTEWPVSDFELGQPGEGDSK
ncbi:amidohydrolase [Paraglaciecola hydrolytica]|uniref:Amidohydrolase n=1 Tax=Paraglaciecola hydrolytica TaxID=1799789 RepID=A0A136A3F6_9ALTE|nr:amidohydrolase [Paraglaciecola hydrolytica]KXI29752.1 amidohydrolase [Paraglaciecola hydrolytica]